MIKAAARVRLALLCGGLSLGLFAGGCGLEQFAPLLAQPLALSAAASYFQFKATADNSESDFLGFELYYKIYRSSDSTSINADQAAIDVFDRLAGRGYRRVNASGDSFVSVTKPLIEVALVDRGETFTVRVRFFDSDSVSDLIKATYPWTEGDGPTLTFPGDLEHEDIRRDVRYTDILRTNEFKRFSDYLEGVSKDGDIGYDGTIWLDTEVNPQVTLVLYVVSYGRDIANDRDLYSQPLKLGEIDITFPRDAD